MGYEQNTMTIAETNWQLIRNTAEIKKRSLSCILFIVGLACVSNCQRIAKENKMNLQVQLKVRTTALIFQENPICQLNLINSGQTELQVLHPMFNPHMPIMRLIHVQTGVEVLRQGKAPMSGDRYQSLPPGQGLSYEFPLLSKVTFPAPGEYEVSAILPFDLGKQRAESKPVRFKVEPAIPRNLSLVSAAGGWSGVQYGVCVNAMSDPPEIVRYGFSLSSEDGVDDAKRVAKATLRIVPVASAPVNQTVAHSHWIAWLEEERMYFSHIDPVLGATVVQKAKLPDVMEAEIVSPLHIDALNSGQQRPTGAALLRTGGPGDQAWQFQVVLISSVGKVKLGARTVITGPRPLWMMSHARTDGHRFVTFIQSIPTGIALNVVPWPDPTRPRSAANKLVEWANEDFVAAGATMTRENAIYGATLMLPTKPGIGKLDMVVWTIDAEGRFAEQVREDVHWRDATPVTKAIVRVGPLGTPAALLSDDKGQWFVYWQGKVQQAPAALATAKLPLDLAFLNQAEPVFIAAEEARGFRVFQLNGQPLPKRKG
jgi:hypothetical protein